MDSVHPFSSVTAARAPRTISERRITHIVSVCTDPIPADIPAGGIKQLRIPVEDVDYVDLLIHFPAACRFIHQAIAEGGTVLVHCGQGLSRSAAVVAAYVSESTIRSLVPQVLIRSVFQLMATRQITATDAQDVVRRAREQVWISPGHQEQLVLWGICQYNVTPDNGVYKKWRMGIANHLPSS